MNDHEYIIVKFYFPSANGLEVELFEGLISFKGSVKDRFMFNPKIPDGSSKF